MKEKGQFRVWGDSPHQLLESAGLGHWWSGEESLPMSK